MYKRFVPVLIFAAGIATTAGCTEATPPRFGASAQDFRAWDFEDRQEVRIGMHITFPSPPNPTVGDYRCLCVFDSEVNCEGPALVWERQCYTTVTVDGRTIGRVQYCGEEESVIGQCGDLPEP